MEPYRPNEPFIKMKLDGSLLDKLVESGIPLSRALKYFKDNPEGDALETLKLTAEDVDPSGLYYTYRNNGDVSDYIKQAVMLAIPFKVGNRSGLIRVPGHSGRRTNGHIPIDDARTAEFREKLQEAINRGPTTTSNPYTHTTRRSLDHFQKMLDAGDAPIKEGLADITELRNAGLEEYYPDIVQRHAAPTRGREINPEDYITYRFEHPEVRQPLGSGGFLVVSSEQPLGTRLLEQQFNARNPDRTLKVFDFDELANTYNNLIELPQYQRPNNPSFTDALIEMYNRERWKPEYRFRDKLNRVGQPYQYTEREITSMHPTNGELMGEYNTAYYGGGVPQRLGGRLTSEDPVKQRIINILESDLTPEDKRFRINQLLNQ